MSKIKSIADEIRERIRAEGEVSGGLAKGSIVSETKLPVRQHKKPTRNDASEREIHQLFDELSAFRMEGNQKIMIRLDATSMKLLKQLKFTRDVDMTKVIVFAFSKFLSANPWLKDYLKEQLKKTENELD